MAFSAMSPSCAIDAPAHCDARSEADEARRAKLRRAKVLYVGGTVVFFTSTFVVFGATSPSLTRPLPYP